MTTTSKTSSIWAGGIGVSLPFLEIRVEREQPIHQIMQHGIKDQPTLLGRRQRRITMGTLFAEVDAGGRIAAECHWPVEDRRGTARVMAVVGVRSFHVD